MNRLMVRILLLFISSFLLYFTVGVLAHWMGFWSLEEMYLVEKALLAVKGEPARFENIGLIYPPIPFILLFLPVFLGTHLLAGPLLSSIYGALILLFLLLSVKKDRVDFLFIFLIALHPLFLYTFSSGGSIGLFIFLILAFIYFHRRFLESEEKDAFSLFMSSLFLGLSVLVRYETVFFVFPVLFTLIYDKNLWRLASKIIVFLFPTVFLFMGWAYINWIYMGDPFYFTRTFLFLGPKLPGSDMLGFRELIPVIFLFPAYVIAILSLRQKPKHLILFLSPPAVFVISTWLMESPLPLSYFCLLGGASLIFLERSKGLIKRASLVASAAGLLISFALPEKLMWGEEIDFTRFLTLRDTKPMFKEEQEAASYLKQLDGKVFFDDTYNYPVVFFHGNPKQFILPYQFKFGFYLRHPFSIAQYALVPDPEGRRDLLNENNGIFKEDYSKMESVKRIGRWRLLKSNSHLLSRP